MAASQTFRPWLTITPMRTEVEAITLPIEMSISPEITSSVSATAITPSTLITLAAVSRFGSVKKNGELIHIRTKTTIRTRISPSPCSCSMNLRRRPSLRSRSSARLWSAASSASSSARLSGAVPPPWTSCLSGLLICHLSPVPAGFAWRALCEARQAKPGSPTCSAGTRSWP